MREEMTMRKLMQFALLAALMVGGTSQVWAACPQGMVLKKIGNV